MRASLGLLLPSLLLLAGCGGGNPAEEGYRALNSGDYASAVAKFDAALAQAEPGSAEHVEYQVARCQALAHTDGDRAKVEFLALLDKAQVQPADLSVVVGDLVAAQAFIPAIELMDAGMKRFPEDPKMVAIKDKVVDESKKADDPAALQKLQGLGYL